MEFTQTDLLDHLGATADADLDLLPFGVVRLDRDGHVTAYNRYEIEATGLSRERVVGSHFFTEVGPCMDNELVAGRFADEAELDVKLDYVFTLRMRPEAVRLRLLKSARAASMYLLVLR